MRSVSAIIDEDFVSLSIQYAYSYKRDGRAFINAFKKFASVRSSCEMIVSTYKRLGAYAELTRDKDFKEYSLKHAKGRSADILSDILLIIYNLTL